MRLKIEGRLQVQPEVVKEMERYAAAFPEKQGTLVIRGTKVIWRPDEFLGYNRDGNAGSGEGQADTASQSS